MATLTADRHFAQRSLLDPHEEERDARLSPPRVARHPDPGLHAAPSPAIRDRLNRGPVATPTPPAPAPEPTFEDIVAGTWTDLLLTNTASCFVCGGELAPRWSAGPRPVGGRCTSCGSEFS